MKSLVLIAAFFASSAVFAQNQECLVKAQEHAKSFLATDFEVSKSAVEIINTHPKGHSSHRIQTTVQQPGGGRVPVEVIVEIYKNGVGGCTATSVSITTAG